MKIKKLPFKSIVGLICLITLLFSIGFAIVQLVNAPATHTPAQPHARLKSDYILMLLQCLLGCVVLFLPAVIERHFQIDIPNYMECMYFIFLYCAIYLGEVRNFFFVVPHWDLILHTFSGAMLGALGFSLVRIMNDSRRIQVTLSPFFVALFAFCFALAAGCIWEIYEFVMDGIFHMNMQKFMLEDGTALLGRMAVADTMEDLIVDTLGALVVCTFGFFALKKKAKAAQTADMPCIEETKV